MRAASTCLEVRSRVACKAVRAAFELAVMMVAGWLRVVRLAGCRRWRWPGGMALGGEAGQDSGAPGAGVLSRAAATASRRLRRAPAA